MIILSVAQMYTGMLLVKDQNLGRRLKVCEYVYTSSDNAITELI